MSSVIAAFHSRKFSPFLEGVTIDLPHVGKHRLKVSQTSKQLRPKGFKFVAHSYMTQIETDSGVREWGFGEDDNELLSFQKSISEAVERVVYRLMKNKQSAQTTNGWASHLSKDKAERSAELELYERDAVLSHWLTTTPMREIDPSSFPKKISTWVEKELSHSSSFNKLRILVSHLGFLPTVTTVIEDENSFAVLSHATKESIADAIEAALAETCRIAHIAADTKTSTLNKLAQPEFHAMYYAKLEKLPRFIFGEKINLKTAEREWKKRFQEFKDSKSISSSVSFSCSGLTVAQANNPQVQKLFFGETTSALSEGLINLHRLKTANTKEINLARHIVP
ncbi:MAG: YcaO-like family protein [Xanthomonadaceae bacterium]|nr:YcaO-like family protein [Xanthomonadaceae bacterium]